MKKSKLVYSRPFKDEDMKSMYHSCQDEELLSMTGTRTSFTFDQIRESYKRFSQDPSRHDFAICSIDTWNKGFGTEAIHLAVAFAFEELQLNQLELEVYSHNVRGIKADEKAGFKKEGTLRQSLYWNHRYSDEILMAMLRADYDNRKQF